MTAASAPDFKLAVKRYVDYLRTQINKNNIKVELNKNVTAADVLNREPDAVILAAGSDPIIPKIPGAEKLETYEANALLRAGTCVGEKVVVLGGGLVGSEAALQLSNCGKDVTIVEMMDDILLTVKHSLNNDQALRRLIDESDVKIRTGTRLVEAADGGVIVEKDGTKETIPCDTLVYAVGYASNRNLENELHGKIEKVVTIGDNVKPAKVIDAVHQGYHTARLLEYLD